MSYTIINDQHKFLAWDPTTQINYGRHASKMVGGILSFIIALSNFILNSNLIVSNPWLLFQTPGLKHIPASVLGTYEFKRYAPSNYVMKHQLVWASVCLSETIAHNLVGCFQTYACVQLNVMLQAYNVMKQILVWASACLSEPYVFSLAELCEHRTDCKPDWRYSGLF